MHKGQFSQDDFGTFLESIKRASKNEHTSRYSSLQIARYLLHSREARVETILTHVRASFKEFTHGLEELSAAGLIRVAEDDEEGRVIQLTEEGQRWAQIIRMEEPDSEENGREKD